MPDGAVLAENKANPSAPSRVSKHVFLADKMTRPLGHSTGHIHIHVYIYAFMLTRFSAEFVLHLYRKLMRK